MEELRANQKLNQLIETKHLNAGQVARLLQYSRATMWRVLTGKRALKSDEIQKISEEFGIPEAEFFSEGYVAEKQTNNEVNELREALSLAGFKYFSAYRGPFKGAEVGILIRKVIPSLIAQKTSLDSRNYLIMGSVGKGQYAEIPWIMISDKAITKTATKGIYIVFLYSSDGKRLYLSLNQGFTYFSSQYSFKMVRNEIATMAKIFRNNIHIMNSRFTDKINLSANGSLGQGYEAGHIIGMEYDLFNMPSDESIVNDILELVSVYQSIKIMFAGRTVEQFYDYLLAENKGYVNLTLVEKGINTENATTSIENLAVNDTPVKHQDPIIDVMGKARFMRDPYTASFALAQGNYECAYDNNHHTFIAKGTNHRYVEAHHLIPLKDSDKFANGLDVPANIVPLCSICHACIHHGTDAAKSVILTKLYNDRKERLKAAGLSINLDELLACYDIQNN